MATSPIYSWPEPDNTDLVKNGALAIRTLGNAIDTTMGTMVAKTVVDAKGDLIAGTAADTVNRLAVGNNGETLVADSSTSTGLRYNANYAAGKNGFINGAFNVWQRGVTFNNAADEAYTADRFQFFKDGTATCNVTQTTFTPGAAPVAGYESQFYLTLTPASYTSGNVGIRQNIEDVRTFAGQTVTISFYAKASTSTSNTILYLQNFGSGGSASVNASAGTVTIGTGWSRHTVSVAIPSVSGKTIGTSSYLMIQLLRYASSATIDIWGVQIEAGSVATAFQTATGTLQGELAACQRYYYEANNYQTGFPAGTTDNNRRAFIQFPVQMRTIPSTYSITVDTGTPTADQASTIGFRAYSAVGNTTTVAYFGLVKASAEL